MKQAGHGRNPRRPQEILHAPEARFMIEAGPAIGTPPNLRQMRNLEPFFPIQGEQQHQHKIITKVIPRFGDELKQVECLPVLTGLDTGFKYGRST
jgi:hypothetical protein